MTQTRECACGQATVRDEAAQWFVRLQEPAIDAEERQRFDAWLAEHDAHRDEYQLLQSLWAATDLVPKARLLALCEAPKLAIKRRPLLRYAVAAGVLAVAVGLGLFSGLNQPAGYSAEFVTALGERRHVALPDGSQVDLNSRSRLLVRYEQGQRSVELSEGEAMFSVEHDSSRPFVVAAGAGKVTVTGTRFDVRRDASQTRVAVEQGRVKVQGRDAADSDFVNLTAGLGTAVDAQGKVAAAYAVDPQALTAWRSGKLVFNNASLSEVAAEVSRYREQPLRVGSEAVGRLRLTSVFKADDTDALLKALPSILPVAVKTHADGSQEIIAR
ncbi:MULTISPECIES: FecR family protein [Pseudomonas]|uniref:FecR family protein n=1 Tax=Pseudomonas TaxID=286 RepID=UPI0007B38860|nr:MULTISPECIES: FecR family protein [Pseudomonas]AZC51878.1 Iron siderophore sensor protein [Pseudomonas chlororaphis subsp. piscium]AZC58325.1 Iron siderophore sensor protein [Pseudomonas chlororaphis subsp. piscium]AZC64529.1 Iron siderophore sensor protein [Pseudomonas chlororaphis subsp. piscium]AZC70780.1 Iron siderophore sensor protein [Pseudomonas chlororaphis subsp. piscium]AZC77012.1 Iron siderophore sensor protein [Pseudomonas chlororaphis subsp. piscium]